MKLGCRLVSHPQIQYTMLPAADAELIADVLRDDPVEDCLPQPILAPVDEESDDEEMSPVNFEVGTLKANKHRSSDITCSFPGIDCFLSSTLKAKDVTPSGKTILLNVEYPLEVTIPEIEGEGAVALFFKRGRRINASMVVVRYVDGEGGVCIGSYKLRSLGGFGVRRPDMLRCALDAMNLEAPKRTKRAADPLQREVKRLRAIGGSVLQKLEEDGSGKGGEFGRQLEALFQLVSP